MRQAVTVMKAACQMKKWKKALVSVLTGCLMVGMLPVGAQASAPAETPYTYTSVSYTHLDVYKRQVYGYIKRD